jgi:P4 family phage/plasmid primase-like protien
LNSDPTGQPEAANDLSGQPSTLPSSQDISAASLQAQSPAVPAPEPDTPEPPASGKSGFSAGGEGLPADEHPATPVDLPAALLLDALWQSPDLIHQISVLHRTDRKFENIVVSSVEEAVAIATEQVRAGNDVYLACAEYATPDSRKAENVVDACGFWLDIDCGPDKVAAGKGYPEALAADQALSAFCTETGLPRWTHHIYSGGGIQVHWIVNQCIEAHDWKPAALKLKALAKTLNFLADPSRTSDVAGVMRFPGTLNFKYDPPRPVGLTLADPPHDRDTLIAAIDDAYELLCGKTLEPPVVSQISAPGEAATTVYGPPNLNKLASALKFLTPDCEEETWKLHRMAPLARVAREHPEMEPELRKLGMDWSSGALRGEPSAAWVTPGKTNGMTGEQAFPGQWTRFLNAADTDKPATLGTIYFDAKEAGWAAESESFDVIDDDIDEEAAASSLEHARVAIEALLVKVHEGDFAAPLEPENLAALSVLYGSDQAAYQRVRINLKKANRQVPLGAIDREMSTRVADNGAAPTHHGYAKTLIRALTVAGWKPISHGGELYVVDPVTNLWVRKDQGKLAKLVAEQHDALDNCTRRSDYHGIAQHAVTLIADEDFFAAAPVGLACPGGFHRIVDGQVSLEPLTPAHRQRVQLPYTPVRIPTPQFDKFLHETFASETAGEEDEQIFLLQEISGAVMLGLMPRFQKAILYYDPFGRSGKGTQERIQRNLVPPSFVTAVSPFSWGKEYYVVSLAGARLNVVGELPDNESIPSAMFKSVLGGDLITGRNPTHRPVSFTNEAAHLFMSNHLINSRDQSEAFFSRWLLVEFPNSRLRSGLPLDPGLADRIIAAEMPGVAHWALIGAIRLLRNGAFSKSKVHDRLMARWRRSNNSLEEFIHECCELAPKGDSTFVTKRAELYRQYAIWCEESGRKPFAKSRVKDLLEHNIGLGITLAKLDGYEIFRGVRLKPSADVPELDYPGLSGPRGPRRKQPAVRR